MELSNNHRSALITELETAQTEAETIKNLLDSKEAKADVYCLEAWQVQDYLLQCRMERIKTALIINNIDY